MPLTPNYNIFYPGSSDPWDMSANLNTMANSIDTALADIGGVKAATTIAGLGTGDFDGQFGWLSGIDAGLRWTGTVWKAIQGQRVADTAARAILFPSPVAGDTVFRVDAGYTEFYNGSAWVRVPGSVLQVQYASTPTAVSTSSSTPISTGLSLTFTPKSSNSLIVISCSVMGIAKGSGAANTAMQISLWVDSTTLINFAVSTLYSSPVGQIHPGVSTNYVANSGNTTARTYKVMFNQLYDAGTVTVQRDGAQSTMTVMEVQL